MSDGTAILIGLCMSAVIVVVFLGLAPLASDSPKTKAEQAKMAAGFLRVQRFLVIALAVAFVVAVFVLDPLQAAFSGISLLMAIAGMLALTCWSRSTD